MARITRQDIVDALTPIPGVSPSLFRPTVVAPGQAWPRIDGLERVQPRIFQPRWSVLLVLGSDDRAAAMQWDILVPLVLDALYGIMEVDEVQAIKAMDEPGAPLCAIFEARSE